MVRSRISRLNSAVKLTPGSGKASSDSEDFLLFCAYKGVRGLPGRSDDLFGPFLGSLHLIFAGVTRLLQFIEKIDSVVPRLANGNLALLPVLFGYLHEILP